MAREEGAKEISGEERCQKSRYVRVVERKEVRRDDPIEYFLHTGVCVCVCVYPSSSLGWRYGMNGNSVSCRQPN